MRLHFSFVTRMGRIPLEYASDVGKFRHTVLIVK